MGIQPLHGHHIRRMVSTQKLQAATALACLATLLGCGTEYRDTEVFFDVDNDGQGQSALDGDPEIILGVYTERTFKALEPGDTALVEDGFQGGTWVHFSIRATAMESSGRVLASLQSGDTVLGSADLSLRLRRAASGYLEAHGVPIPIGTSITGQAYHITDFIGQTANLKVTYNAADRSATATVELIVERE